MKEGDETQTKRREYEEIQKKNIGNKNIYTENKMKKTIINTKAAQKKAQQKNAYSYALRRKKYSECNRKRYEILRK